MCKDPLFEFSELVIYSPHFDDAFLSLGGYLGTYSLLKKNIEVLIIFGKTSYVKGENDSKNIQNVSDLRQQEEKVNVQKINGKLIVWNNISALSRGYELMPRKAFAYPTILNPDDKILLDQISQRIIKHVKSRKKSTLHLFPLSLGDHVDHKIVNHAGVSMLNSKINIGFYEDMPYACQNQNKEPKYNLRPVLLPTNIEMKSEFLTSYRTQNCIKWFEDIKDYMRKQSFNHIEYLERIWLSE